LNISQGAGKRILVVDPTCGMSGDMFLAALMALGADLKTVKGELKKLGGLERFDIKLEKVKKKGLVASRAVVECAESHHERNLGDILGMIDSSGLDERVKGLSGEVFRALAEAEGKVHGLPTEKVHFHEVGALDSIIDIIGAVVALKELGFPDIFHRPFVLGSGTIEIAHGRIPLPAPATIELLEGRRVSFVDEPFEIITPTAAALMRVLAMELPAGFSCTPERVVYAVGSREEAEVRSMLRVIEAQTGSYNYGDVVVVKTVIDDMNPEIHGFVREKLSAAGALDVYITQVVMKKGRPGVELTVLCREEELGAVVDVLLRETTTIGMRISREARVEIERWTEKLETLVGEVEVKFCRLPDGSVKGSPEYESCRALALESGVPIREIYSKAMIAVDSYIAEKNEGIGNSGS